MKNDWILCSLGEVFDFIGGGTPSKTKPEYWNGNIPWASIKDLKGYNLQKTQDFITEKGLINSSANIANANEIIIATRINPGTPILSKIKTAINQDLKIAKPKIQSEIDYFFWLFNTLKPEILKLSSGTTVLGINLINLKSIQFKLPPIPIQKAIVRKIEALFSSLDSGIADLKKAQDQLKIYRQAVLKKAFEGEYSQKKFDVVTIDSICEVVRGGSPRPAGDERFYNGEIPFMKVKDISRNNGVYVNQAEHSIKEAGLYKTRLVSPETLLLTNSGATLGVPAITSIATTFNDGIAAFLNLDDNLLYHYYYWFSKTVYLRNLNQGAAQPNLNTSVIGSMKIPIYNDKKEHSKIVQEIESRLSVCDKVEESIKESLLKAQALRQSILKKAFEGKLLSGDEIAACKAHPYYEPASVLLERIKKEKISTK